MLFARTIDSAAEMQRSAPEQFGPPFASDDIWEPQPGCSAVLFARFTMAGCSWFHAVLLTGSSPSALGLGIRNEEAPCTPFEAPFSLFSSMSYRCL